MSSLSDLGIVWEIADCFFEWLVYAKLSSGRFHQVCSVLTFCVFVFDSYLLALALTHSSFMTTLAPPLITLPYTTPLPDEQVYTAHVEAGPMRKALVFDAYR